VILQKIIDHKKMEVEELKMGFDLGAAIKRIEGLPPAKSLAGALKNPGRVSLLAEIKRASPSRGIIREDFSPVEIAGIYDQNGADAISVLTDQKFFSGAPAYLSQVREKTGLPLLRKDFIIDPAQIYQARLLGADAVLLICAALSPERLGQLMKTASAAGMEALVEVHDEYQLEWALKAGAGIIGINNRNLKTFVTDLDTTIRLCGGLKATGAVVVSESGIKTREDVKMLGEAGIDAVLVGESIMAADDVAAKVRELAGVGKSIP
jgi:indole-3-glycerol phosphate synthase